ncbi:MAG: 23S rRNA (guanosine(2251)-2'-O)-methyltransferase RlmB [Chlamydiales bacterium]|nr:23S rRNA (guanosine(2251)-2'-O)-methyltransferase RlmB [Chlamydiales bacterium]
MSHLIMGRNCIAEVLKVDPERILEVYTCQKPGGDELYHKLVQAKIKITERQKHQLAQMVNSESHQSYVAKVKDREWVSVKDFLREERAQSVVLMLDSINDPQNFGAILRAAECFGVNLVIYSKNRGVDITPVVSKVSAGASELVPIACVSNLAETMKAFQKSGYWAMTADVGEGSQNLYEHQPAEKTLLVMGSEGKGVQPLIVKKCDFHLHIPMKGQIDSLNVSQATSVFLSFLCRH